MTWIERGGVGVETGDEQSGLHRSSVLALVARPLCMTRAAADEWLDRDSLVLVV